MSLPSNKEDISLTHIFHLCWSTENRKISGISHSILSPHLYAVESFCLCSGTYKGFEEEEKCSQMLCMMKEQHCPWQRMLLSLYPVTNKRNPPKLSLLASNPEGKGGGALLQVDIEANY